MNFIRTVFASCSHFRNYRAFRDQPVWVSLKYLIKLTILLSFIGLVSFIPVASERVEIFAQWADQHLPAFALKDGKVQTTVEQPFQTGDNTFRFILDTTGKITEADTNATQGLLVNADSLLFWVVYTNDTKAVVHAQRQNLKGFPDGAVNGSYFRQLIHAFAWMAIPLTWLVIILLALLTSLVQAYIFALLASMMERGNPRGLQLAQLLNIAIHAVTPAAIIYTIYLALRLEGVNLWLVYLVIYGIFVVGASNACRDRLPNEAQEEDGEP